MASNDHVSDSDGSSDEIDLLRTPEKREQPRELSLPMSGLSHRFRSPQAQREELLAEEPPRARTSASEEKRIAVLVQGPARPWEYLPFVGDTTTVDAVLAQLDQQGGQLWYRIEYEDGRREDVSREDLIGLRNGRNALSFFDNGDEGVQSTDSHSQFDRSSADMSSSNAKRRRTKTKPQLGFVNSTVISTDDETSGDQFIVKKRPRLQGRSSFKLNTRKSSRAMHNEEDFGSEAELSNQHGLRSSNRALTRQTRSSKKLYLKLTQKNLQDDETDELADSQNASDGPAIIFHDPNTKAHSAKSHRSRSVSKAKRGRSRRIIESDSSAVIRGQPTRMSGRERVVKSMKERDMNEEIFAENPPVDQALKVVSIREIYPEVSKKSRFYIVHSNACDICGGVGKDSNKGSSPLIHCQGCSTSIHRACLGYRSSREHRVTKIGRENFVMQCRRCIGIAANKDSSAPPLDTCQGCNEAGPSCAAFSPKKSSKQEEKLREENGGDDPITEVSANLVNNSDNVLFRCDKCRRAWHLEHLPPFSDESDNPEDLEELRDTRLNEYHQWQCKDCQEAPGKVHLLVAWRPADRESYELGQTVRMLREDKKEYLVKWVDQSYFQCTWMPGGWVWGVTVSNMRNKFFDRDEGANQLPKWTTQEAIREDFLRMEIILDVKYDGYVSRSKSSDKKHVADVERVLVKFLGLGYDEVVWEEPPPSDNNELWNDFVAAYNEYLAGKYFETQSVTAIQKRIKEFRSLNFQKEVELKEQPSALTGGTIMDYQKEGMNWLLFKFHQKKNAILADEMGLGKTIQIISFIAALVRDKPECWPFLIVTPNSTCPNWRRETKKWAPDLRVVAYYGGKDARKMAIDYELFPENCEDMRAHIVITSYEAPVSDGPFFRKVKWAGLIVDEGQRLKNDQNQLYSALKALKVSFQVLLTGTPLQNNKRELFNLLQFVDSKLDAAQLDEQYQELTNENLPELHNLIQPFLLRRTKLEVLDFLPPYAQVILPVTMSIVQKKLYKSILGRNAELIKSIMGQSQKVLKQKERIGLNNILMLLRKCLCHPFIYSDAIEERSDDPDVLHRNLVAASSKFQLLEIMLPKLRERGNRVLLFSQFLDQLTLVEDFLNHLDLPFQRLDGSMNAFEKQKRIDQFNAPDSKLFAFLLSTRAGGVGINLATADTVIIMDPDFNPHQDIQALSRAHRIGQKKKVLVFQLMTKDSAEEKIVQIGRKKLALDKALIRSNDMDDDAEIDLESILKHGAAALFNDDDRNDIHYNSASVDKLLDRTLIEDTSAVTDNTAESQFSFARVWANEAGHLTNEIGEADAESPTMDLSTWATILKQREADAAAEAEKNMDDFGRGRRKRNIPVPDYRTPEGPIDANATSKKGRGKGRGRDESEDDQYVGGENSGDDDSDDAPVEDDIFELGSKHQQGRSKTKLTRQEPPRNGHPGTQAPSHSYPSEPSFQGWQPSPPHQSTYQMPAVPTHAQHYTPSYYGENPPPFAYGNMATQTVSFRPAQQQQNLANPNSYNTSPYSIPQQVYPGYHQTMSQPPPAPGFHHAGQHDRNENGHGNTDRDAPRDSQVYRAGTTGVPTTGAVGQLGRGTTRVYTAGAVRQHGRDTTRVPKTGAVGPVGRDTITISTTKVNAIGQVKRETTRVSTTRVKTTGAVGQRGQYIGSRYVLPEVPEPWEVCRRCTYPHLGASPDCPDRAVHGQVRLMLDSVPDHLSNNYEPYLQRLSGRLRELMEASNEGK